MRSLNEVSTENLELYSSEYFDYLKSVLDSIDLSTIVKFTEILLDARDKSATIFFIGNGGSAATASHFDNDLCFGINDSKEPFKVVSLTDSTPVITAIANDFGYEEVFKRQLEMYGKSGDVLVGISASGNSSNLLKAFNYASDVGIHTVAITAFDGGNLKLIANDGIHVPTNNGEYGPAEDAHMIIDHLVSSYLMRMVNNA